MVEGAARDVDKVDLVAVARAVWARRVSIVAVAVVCSLIGYAVGALVIKNRASSFLQLSYTAPVTTADEKADKEGKELRFRTNIAEYKVLNAAILGRDGFLAYAAKGKGLDPDLIARLSVDLAKDNLVMRWVHPVFAIARSDLREIPDQQTTEANYLVGVDISVERRSPNEALAIAIVLGDYVRDSAIMLRAREFATGLLYKATSRLLDLDRQLISTRLSLAQAEARQRELAAIRNRYPDAVRGDVRQVISVDKGTSRFLPPVTQLVGVESQIAEIHEAILVAEWDIERSKALIAFLEPAQALIRESSSGEQLFPRMDRLMDTTFDEKRMKSDPWRDAFNTVKIEITGLKTLYFERMRFIASPALNEIPLWVRLLPALAGFLAGAVVASLVIFARASFARAHAAAA